MDVLKFILAPHECLGHRDEALSGEVDVAVFWLYQHGVDVEPSQRSIRLLQKFDAVGEDHAPQPTQESVADHVGKDYCLSCTGRCAEYMAFFAVSDCCPDLVNEQLLVRSELYHVGMVSMVRLWLLFFRRSDHRFSAIGIVLSVLWLLWLLIFIKKEK